MNISKSTLNLLKKGESAVIVDVSGEERKKTRLKDLGFEPGSEVKCLYHAPSGNPAAYLVKGAVIALRNEDASCISVDLRERKCER